MSLQPNFVSREEVKEGSSLIPHPPQAFGRTIFSHTTQGITCSTFDPFHKNLLHNLLIDERTLFGMQERVAQYTRMAMATDLISTSLLARHSHLKLQCFIHESIFATS